MEHEAGAMKHRWGWGLRACFVLAVIGIVYGSRVYISSIIDRVEYPSVNPIRCDYALPELSSNLEGRLGPTAATELWGYIVMAQEKMAQEKTKSSSGKQIAESVHSPDFSGHINLYFPDGEILYYDICDEGTAFVGPLGKVLKLEKSLLALIEDEKTSGL